MWFRLVDWPVEMKAVRKLLKINQKLYRVAMVGHSTVTDEATHLWKAVASIFFNN